MNKNRKVINKSTKKKLRLIGFTSLSIGLILAIIAFIDFFNAIASFSGMPKLFFLFFIGFPFIGVGITCLSYGYMGEVAKYTSQEISPVAKDTINYLIDGTKDEITSAVKTVKNKIIICPKCQHENDIDAKFCDECGEQLLKTCPNCNTINDNDANYCKSCRTKL